MSQNDSIIEYLFLKPNNNISFKKRMKYIRYINTKKVVLKSHHFLMLWKLNKSTLTKPNSSWHSANQHLKSNVTCNKPNLCSSCNCCKISHFIRYYVRQTTIDKAFLFPNILLHNYQYQNKYNITIFINTILLAVSV